MKHFVLFLIKDVGRSTAACDFISDFQKNHCTTVDHLRRNGMSQLSALHDCGKRLQIGVISACLTRNTTCFDIMKSWYDSDFDGGHIALETICAALMNNGKDVNENVLLQHSDSASTLMDSLLDSIQSPDTSRLHVVVDEDLVPYWPMSETCTLLLGSLLRASEWHSALFYPLGGEDGRAVLDRWLQAIPGATLITTKDRIIFSGRIREHTFLVAVDHEESSNDGNVQDKCRGGSLRWTSDIDTLKVVALQSIPVTFFEPRIQLYASHTKFLEDSNLTDQEGLLVRLGTLESTTLGERDVRRTSSNWKTSIMEGGKRLQFVEWEPNGFLYFLIIGNGSVYPLVKDVSLDFTSMFQPFHPVALPNIKALPIFDGFQECSMTSTLDVYSYLSDPSEWPQRRFLAPSTKEANTQSNVLSVDASTIVTLFDRETGLAAEPFNACESIKSDRITLRPTISVDAAAEMEWPEILKHTSHDVYYNRSNEDEAWERSCHRWKEAVLRNPTATSMDEQTTCIVRNRTSKKKESPRKNLFERSPQFRRRSPRKKNQISPYRDSSKVLRRNPFRDILREASSSSMEQLNEKKEPEAVAPRQTRSRTTSQADIFEAPPASKRTRTNADTERMKRKLREAVASALESTGIPMSHELFPTCGKKLFAICKTFAVELVGRGRTSEILRNIANSHVKQVVEFEKTIRQSTMRS